MIKSMIFEYDLVKLETNIIKIIRNMLEIKPDTTKLSLSQRKTHKRNRIYFNLNDNFKRR